MTHAEAVRLVRGKTKRLTRKLGNNTWGVIHANGDVGIILHSTEVVTIHTDGTYTIRSGGWRTVTTKDRICKYCPYYVTQRKWEWFVGYYDGDRHHDVIPFEDGMRLSHDLFGELVAN
jgi:hypothetical protein